MKILNNPSCCKHTNVIPSIARESGTELYNHCWRFANGKVSVKCESEDLPEFNSLKSALRKHLRYMPIKSSYILSCLFFVLSAKHTCAQQQIDSVQQIDTVKILSHKEGRGAQCLVSVYKTPEVTVPFSRSDIGEALQQFTSVQINSYGLGNSASISVRGANDDHTNVYWNGLKINSLTLGGTDISLIPFESGDEIAVETNNTSIGGTLSILSKPNWRNTADLKIRSDISSFDNYRNSLSFKTGNAKIQFHTSAFYHTAINNFTYEDVYKFNNPIDTARHNALKSAGTVSQLFFQLKKQTFISIGSWYQQKSKELPAIMGSNIESSKYQKDRSVRHFIHLDKTISKGDMHFALAHAFDEMKYTDKRMPTDTFLFVNTNYITNRITNSFLINNNFKHNLSLQSGYLYNINVADVKEYVKKVTDHVGEVYTHLRWKQEQFSAAFRITQPFSSFKYVRPQFFAEAGYETKNQEKNYAVNISYSDKYRFPDLNDRYWNPGGDPNLKPEFGWTLNVSNRFQAYKRGHSFQATLSLYYSNIKNNIVWTPVTNVIWSPKNLKSTRLYGIEWDATYSFTPSDKLYVFLKTLYNFNRAQIIEDANNADLNGHYLRYKPQHTLKTNFYVEQKFAGIGLIYTYTSARFTDEENFDFFALHPYHLLDFYLTFKGTIKTQHQVQCVFKINNITNTVYESVRSYAQPQRYYSLSLIYNFSKLQK